MINAVNEVISQKTTNQYMIIESKYEILKNYLHLFFKDHCAMSKDDADLIINSLEGNITEIALYADGKKVEESYD